jgi:hypothetical protein
MVVDPRVRGFKLHKIGKRKRGADPSRWCWEGHVEKDQHFFDSHIGKVKGKSCDDSQNTNLQFDHSGWITEDCRPLI